MQLRLVGADNSNDGECKLGWNKNNVGWWYLTDIVNKYYYIEDN